eukprot:TRINITY_DN9333_c0_g1_i9.p1 TRINITY_DN9333_c0_g1~~TRINITY_DN9333_c0_g1_i9.p1  ORF type:complete len:331 (+),score=41.13 TRINITY_DN9333_c0_g1_i9:65-1057(+)
MCIRDSSTLDEYEIAEEKCTSPLNHALSDINAKKTLDFSQYHRCNTVKLLTGCSRTFDQDPSNVQEPIRDTGSTTLFFSSKTSTENNIADIRTHPALKLVNLNLRNGDFYVGGLLNNTPHGKGKYMYKDGSMYNGEWSYGKRSGYGREEWVDVGVYEGYFLNGRKNGEGTLTLTNGITYEGEFKNDDFHGQGKMTWEDGTVYRGSWVAGKRQGQGEQQWSCGRKYIGSFENDVPQGNGELTFSKGHKFVGVWKRGQPEQNGLIVLSDGRSFPCVWDGASHFIIDWKPPASVQVLETLTAGFFSHSPSVGIHYITYSYNFLFFISYSSSII